MAATSTVDTTDDAFKQGIEKITLEDVQKVPDLGFLGFSELVCKNFGKDGRMQRLVYKRYLELAVDALKSEDKKIAEDGKKMMEHFKTERAQVDTFWGKPPQVSSLLNLFLLLLLSV